jgi:ParB family transcriptional regulator, chromosome partitioning protein
MTQSQTNARRSLGRGLSALLSEAKPQAAAAGEGRPGAAVLRIPVELIRPDARQPRQDIDGAGIEELAASIAQQGLLQPVLVRREGNKYRLIAGERRWRAAQKAGLKEIPALVREAGEAEAFELALVENLQREDLSPIEEAEGFRRLLDERKWTQEQVADRVGKNRSTVANALRLLALPEEVKKLLRDGALEMGHARALLGLSGKAEMAQLARAVVAEKLSVRETEARVRAGKPGGSSKKPAASARLSADARALVEDLQRRSGTRVRLRERAGGKGTLEFEFNSYKDLERLVGLIRR